MGNKSQSGWLWWVFGSGGLLLFLGLFLIRMEVTSTAVGVVRAGEQQMLYAPRAGRVADVVVEPGERVQQGDVLMRLEDSGLGRDLLSLRARLGEIEEAIALAEVRRRELEITGGMREAGLGEIYQREAEVRLDRQRGLRELVEAELALLEREAASLEIRAPFDGVVSNVYARNHGMRVGAGDPLLMVADPDSGFEVRAFVRDRNVDLIRPGLPVRMESHVYQSSAEGYILGTVERIVLDPAGEETHGRDGFEVVIRLESYPVDPVLGQRVDVKIIVEDAGPLDLLFHRSLRGGSAENGIGKESER